MFFAATRISNLPSLNKYINFSVVKKFQPLCQQFVKLGSDAGFSEDAVYEQVINPALRILTESMRLSEEKGDDAFMDIEFLEKTIMQIATDVFDMKVKDIKQQLSKTTTDMNEPVHIPTSTQDEEGNATASPTQTSPESTVKAIEARWTYQDPTKKKITHIVPTGAGIGANLDPPPGDHTSPLLNSETEKQQCQPQQVYNVNPNIIHLVNKYELMPFFVESNNIPGGAGFYFETHPDMQLDKNQASMFWILLMVNQQITEIECLPESSHFRWLYTRASEEERELFFTMNLGIETMVGKAPLFDAVFLIETFLMEPKLLDVLDEAQDKSGVKWQIT